MEEEKDLIILTKYIIGEASNEEKIFINLWITQDPSHGALYIELKALWHGSIFYESDNGIDVDKAYKLFRKKIEKPKHTTFVMQFSKFKVAAMIAILLSIGGLIFFITGKNNNTKSEYSQEIVVPKGHQKKISLNDGTIVWLNSASILQIDNEFGKKNRNVYLEGEGYFVVAHDKNLVFTIATKDYTVRDIGTEFNVKAFPDESIFETAVMDGKISVEGKFTGNDKISTIFLAKNAVLKIQRPALEQAKPPSLVKSAPIVVVKNSPNIDTYNYWKDDMMVFDNLSFKEIALQLERKYNVVILIKDDSLNNYHYSGNFNKIPNIEKVLDIIQETTPISFQLARDTVTIKTKVKKQIAR